MQTSEPTESQKIVFAAREDDTSPVIMLNLLRYRKQADSTDCPGESVCSGREAYQRYAVQAMACIESVGGVVCFE